MSVWIINTEPVTESANVLAKHVRAEKTFYVDLNQVIPEGATISAPSADSESINELTISDVSVVSVDTVLEQSSTCHGSTLYADRAISLVIADGVSSDDEVIVTVNWTQSDGDTGSVDCRLVVSGRAAP